MARNNAYLTMHSNYGYLMYDSNNAGVKLVVSVAGGPVVISGSPSIKLVMPTSTNQYGVLALKVPKPSGADLPATCAINASDRTLSCTVSHPAGAVFDTFWICGEYIYLARANWIQSGYTKTALQLTSALV